MPKVVYGMQKNFHYELKARQRRHSVKEPHSRVLGRVKISCSAVKHVNFL